MCGFLNNVEGNWEYFKRYIDESAILAWDDSENAEHLPVTKGKRLKFTNDDSMFVFGGNSQVMIHYPPCPSLSLSRSRAVSICPSVLTVFTTLRRPQGAAMSVFWRRSWLSRAITRSASSSSLVRCLNFTVIVGWHVKYVRLQNDGKCVYRVFEVECNDFLRDGTGYISIRR